VICRYPRLAELLQRRSLRRGQFVLSSGRRSSYYIDGKLTSFDPEGATAIAAALFDEIKGLSVDAVGGMDMGATPIVGAFAVYSLQAGRPLPTFVVRKEVKAHGTMKQVEGPIPPAPAKVVIVDDVVTSGDSIIKAIDAVQRGGYEVVLAVSVLDRNAGANEAISSRNVPYRPLLTLADLGILPEPAPTA